MWRGLLTAPLFFLAADGEALTSILPQNETLRLPMALTIHAYRFRYSHCSVLLRGRAITASTSSAACQSSAVAGRSDASRRRLRLRSTRALVASCNWNSTGTSHWSCLLLRQTISRSQNCQWRTLQHARLDRRSPHTPIRNRLKSNQPRERSIRRGARQRPRPLQARAHPGPFLRSRSSPSNDHCRYHPRSHRTSEFIRHTPVRRRPA
jgi:hypothetical protein